MEFDCIGFCSLPFYLFLMKDMHEISDEFKTLFSLTIHVLDF